MSQPFITIDHLPRNHSIGVEYDDNLGLVRFRIIHLNRHHTAGIGGRWSWWYPIITDGAGEVRMSYAEIQRLTNDPRTTVQKIRAWWRSILPTRVDDVEIPGFIRRGHR